LLSPESGHEALLHLLLEHGADLSLLVNEVGCGEHAQETGTALDAETRDKDFDEFQLTYINTYSHQEPYYWP
jgi:hypothetical protein